MFIELVVTGDKVWAPFSGTLPSEFFEDIDNDILEENEEENVIMMFTLMETIKKKHLRQELHILILEGRNSQSKSKGL
ncbi:hypothetical protein Gotri_022012 [Gossypium trilobum]|uniref:Uncharacterized protein n=1 Tax=Gossypium trilobum TaxID=34281 RepID=A0A7J9DED6_9ROSI|nr:hypothetical protein [Gossypium trilobum]MBA0759083.1 hypothetical protein [Gossypium trilobum]